ncbi:Asp-tRNA(Asn)/Glu-tRNA(Gln) amidotransferase subunit GatC [Eisenibacter elegans]|jgi:aspartyl-tRNA(Asn)/glutamyl-tRNA(Gln) amidotransferase subunit C|uniref:Asp-tRNA(Asn)/Glu-tRNA(Gln) amidotransferase subunit GatC n=1 Tax=Eisenibacter elegans TaxID=997 RepID=UPI0004085E3F|nr:Asp-tRNA(Asn)/Glu-tRNA(Gln) amidotransferase subunit GatC [Eisenibacter elegans]
MSTPKVDIQTLEKLAHLSRLSFDASTAPAMIADLNKILNWIDQLDAIDTKDVAPLIHMSEEVNQLRPDEVKPHLDHQRGLSQAPAKDSDYFRVPKVLDQSQES